jgi:ketosteroid isomerase-like protein
MKYFGILFMVIALFITSCMNEPALPSEDEAKEVIKEKVETAAQRYAAGDGNGYVEMVAADVTYMDDIASPELLIGKDNFKTYVENIAANVPPHIPILSAFHWQHYGDIMILTYRYQGNFDGQLAPPWKITSVFRYENGDWMSVHENWSLVKEPESDLEE